MSKTITELQLQELATEQRIPAALVGAVTDVEAPNGGHLPDGRPAILFEGHVFYSLLPKGKRDEVHRQRPTLCFPEWNATTRKYYVGGAGEHARLAIAAAIDREAALKACSWGKAQILGKNHAAAGFPKLQDFINCMYGPEKGHIAAMLTFIKSWGKQYRAFMAIPHYTSLADLVLRCAAFAECYNGKGYKANKYDTKLADRFLKRLGKR